MKISLQSFSDAKDLIKVNALLKNVIRTSGEHSRPTKEKMNQAVDETLIERN